MPQADIWPDNFSAVQVFIRMSTQWRVGFGGAYGLDYNALPVVAPCEVKAQEWPDTLESIRVLEESALEVFAQQRELEERKRKRNG